MHTISWKPNRWSLMSSPLVTPGTLQCRAPAEIAGASHGRFSREQPRPQADSSDVSELARIMASVHPLIWLTLLIVACLVPFVNKAFFIDDTLFLRAAEQIQKHPLNFYGFSINWFDYTSPMTEAFENPPLTSYYIALVAGVVGWSEPALHLAFLLPALAAAWGTFALAKAYCKRPLLAAVLAVVTPAFLISATNLMCDVMLLAFWVWSVVVFEKGLQKDSAVTLACSGCLAGLAVLTKFPALALAPLLAAYGSLRTRRAGWWVVAPVMPILFALAYELITRKLYGEGLLLGAARYASKFRGDSHDILWEKMVIGLGFAGGCYLPVLFYAPLIWSRRVLLAGLCCISSCLLFVPRMAAFATLIWHQDGSLDWTRFAYIAVLAVGGVQVLALAAMDWCSRRDAVSALLLLWVAGVLVFTTSVNWTVNGRSLLPAVPALGILIARRLEGRGSFARRAGFGSALWPALPATAISLLLVKADFDLANTYRAAAQDLFTKYCRPGKTVWFGGQFGGHWGFQYYIEQLGAKPLEFRSIQVGAGDTIVLPGGLDGRTLFSSNHVQLVETSERTSNKICATMSRSAGAGFYAAILSSSPCPLPFVPAPIEPERFTIYEASRMEPVRRDGQ